LSFVVGEGAEAPSTLLFDAEYADAFLTASIPLTLGDNTATSALSMRPSCRLKALAAILKRPEDRVPDLHRLEVIALPATKRGKWNVRVKLKRH
jgi:hypothetical protein